MKLYLYIDGTLMPMPPSSVSVISEGGSDYITISDGSYHVFATPAAPVKISLELTVSDAPSEHVYGDSVLVTPDLVSDHFMSRLAVPFELVLLGVDDEDRVICDINMTVISEEMMSVYHEGGVTVTIKARRYKTAEVSG